MLRPLLRSLAPMQIKSHSQRSMTGMGNKKNPFVKHVKQKLRLPATTLETISVRDRDMDDLVQVHLSSQKTKHGGYDFLECQEGYILCYINAFQQKNLPQNVFYGVYYGEKHPLNMGGSVTGVQTLPHGKDNAILSAIQNFPKLGDKKLCICTNCSVTIRMMRRLPEYSENGYHAVATGRVLERKETYEKLVEAICLRTDLKIRFLYTSSEIIHQMRAALRVATSASRPEIE